MERVARLINQHKNSQKVFQLEDFVRSIWPSAVGKTIARHTGRLRVVRETLVIEVQDSVWQRQLFSLSGQILNSLQKSMGSMAISQLEFRVAVPRREPGREDRPRNIEAAPASGDEADAILDPVLKKVYRLSRKRSTA